MIAADILTKVGVGIIPVVVFLLALLLLDSYKLLPLSRLLSAIAAGAAVALASYFVNTAVLGIGLPFDVTVRYITPLFEELGKALVCVAIFRRNQVGFMVDAAIYGFAVGAGFACLENMYFLGSAPDANIATWIVRGFGTALMHGAATSLYCLATRVLLDRHPDRQWSTLVPGLGLAYLLHSAYNHFILPPLASALLMITILPVIFIAVFRQSEKITRDWLGAGFDTDQELLRLILDGRISDTRVGRYLGELQTRFAGPVVADMLCWLRLHLELAIEAKGLLLMRQAGFVVKPGKDARSKFEELHFLEKSIGKTGLMAIAPIVHASSRELWQLHMLGSGGRSSENAPAG